MERVFPWIAVIFASVIAIVGIFELDMRSDEDRMALPTAIPSPTDQTTPGVQATPTEAPAVPPATTPVQTEAPSTPEPTEEPTAEPTEAPTDAPTASPEPEAPGPPAETPVIPEPEPMPHTGGGAIGGGIAVFGLAIGVRFAMRRSYSS
ncbi:MAG TPA: hypothetical protein VFA34_06645 [Actinomycetota bacterium]|nr:hypothetical protein [Actinomycetota bacterium]